MDVEAKQARACAGRIFKNKIKMFCCVLGKRLSFSTDSGGGGWDTKNGSRGESRGESRQCSFEARDGRTFLAGNFCAAFIYPTDLCHFRMFIT